MSKKRRFIPLQIKSSNRAGKKSLTGFTMIELLTVISIIALLMAVLMPTLTEVKNQARNAMCLQRLQQWSIMFKMYADDWDGKLMDDNYYTIQVAAGGSGGSSFPTSNSATNSARPLAEGDAGVEWITHAWVRLMYPYYRTFDMCMCPAAIFDWTKLKRFDDPLASWAFEAFAHDPFIAAEADSYYLIDGKWAYGSYGKNTWVTEASTEMAGGDDYYSYDYHFLNVQMKNANQIPLFGDCNHTGGFPHVHDEPAEFRYHGPVDMTPPGEINRWNLDRHKLSINLLFLDWSVRKVGLKQLWQLRWSQEIGWGDPDIVPDPEEPTDWPDWMQRAKNYDL
ncbi:MAG: type II secretion system protein [Planctomycetota bacterium]|jgi:prepilin-type N-terminal cleavage/methylation domain-containing protein